MAQENLKRLSKVELLEMLLAQSRRVEELEQQVERLKARLADRTLIVEESGDLATACLRINGVFEAAQAAADQYLDNIAQICDRKRAAAELEALRIMQQARDDSMAQKLEWCEKGDRFDEGQKKT